MLYQRRNLYAFRIVFLLVFGVICFSQSAQAYRIDRPFRGRRPTTLDAPLLGLKYARLGGAFGLRVGFPILHNGFVPSINNAVHFLVGADFYFEDYYGDVAVSLGIPFGIRWSFYFTRQWSAFAEIGASLYLSAGVLRGNREWILSPEWFSLAIGGKFHVNETFAFILRIGAPYSSIGCSFSFF